MVVTSLKVDLFEQKLHQTAEPQLIDVRTPKEFSEGYIPGAILMDIKQASFDMQIQQLDRSRPVFVYCRSGKRSMEAAKVLVKYQFEMVYNLEGGIIAWGKTGKAVVTDNDTTN